MGWKVQHNAPACLSMQLSSPSVPPSYLLSHPRPVPYSRLPRYNWLEPPVYSCKFQAPVSQPHFLIPAVSPTRIIACTALKTAEVQLVGIACLSVRVSTPCLNFSLLAMYRPTRFIACTALKTAEVQLAGTACLWIATKYEEVLRPTSCELAAWTGAAHATLAQMT